MSFNLTQELCDHFETHGYAYIDDFLDIDLARQLRDEMIELSKKDVMLPNRTHFASPLEPTKHYLFPKPGIFEVDLHQDDVRESMPNMSRIFEESRDVMIPTLESMLKKTKLSHGNNARTVKLQWNQGIGGCFPCHYDNPGPPNNRCITCIIYLNPEWEEGDGGEVTLYPFLQQSVKIAPRMNRLVMFSSYFMLHRVERAWKDRYCITVWIDGPDTNSPENVQLKLPANALNDIEGTVRYLEMSPLQRSLCRAVYREEYEISLHECMMGAEGRNEMVAAHQAHLDIVARNSLLTKLVDALRNWRVEHNFTMDDEQKVIM